MSDYEIRLNEKEEQLSEDSSELKIYRGEITKLKSEKDKLVKRITELKMKSVEVLFSECVIHVYNHKLD